LCCGRAAVSCPERPTLSKRCSRLLIKPRHTLTFPRRMTPRCLCWHWSTCTGHSQHQQQEPAVPAAAPTQARSSASQACFTSMGACTASGPGCASCRCAC
jgi:hypothetical protein